MLMIITFKLIHVSHFKLFPVKCILMILTAINPNSFYAIFAGLFFIFNKYFFGTTFIKRLKDMCMAFISVCVCVLLFFLLCN